MGSKRYQALTPMNNLADLQCVRRDAELPRICNSRRRTSAAPAGHTDIRSNRVSDIEVGL